MYSFNIDSNDANYQIESYTPGCLTINGQQLTQSVIITPQQLFTDWEPQTITELVSDHLARILTLKPSVLLLGTGATLVFPDISLYGHLINHGIGVEIMDTSAACRTYNALSAENRSVAAALLIR